jgi:hypothetical protein
MKNLRLGQGRGGTLVGSQLPDIISLHELLEISLALGHLNESMLQKFLGSWSLKDSNT